jgi:type II secretory pathway component PulM
MGRRKRQAAPHTREVPIELGPSVADARVAELIRRVALESLKLTAGVGVVLDLPEAQVFSSKAAHALLVPWLQRHPAQAVAIRNFSPVAKDAFDTVLRLADEVVRWIPSAPDGAEAEPQLIGAVSAEERALLDDVAAHGGEMVFAAGEAPPPATDDATRHGVITREQRGDSIVLRDPFAHVAA